MSINSELSDREIEILRLVATGASNKEIARDLHISTNTVKVHLRNIFAKIQVESRTEAALYAVKVGLVEQDVPVEPSVLNGSTITLGVQGQIQENLHPGEESPLVLQVPQKVNRWRDILLAAISLAVVITLVWIVSNNPSNGLRRDFEVVIPTVPTRWNVLAPMPTARYGFACIAYENKIFAIGGKTNDATFDVVELYDIQTGEWTERASKPTPVSNISAAVLRGRIYVPGGELFSGEITDQLEIYDIQRDAWLDGAALPIPLAGYAFTAHEGRLYVFGGWDGEKISKKVFEYIPEDDQWVEKSDLSTARMNAGAVSVGGKIILIGGTDGDEFLTLNEAYTPNLDQEMGDPWESLAPLPTGRAMFGISSLSDIVYIIGGNTDTMAGSELLGYFPSINQWQYLESQVLNSWSQLGMAGVESYLYLMGGNIDGEVTDQNLSYRAIYTVLFPVIK